jgi:hypothetical protein
MIAQQLEHQAQHQEDITQVVEVEVLMLEQVHQAQEEQVEQVEVELEELVQVMV